MTNTMIGTHLVGYIYCSYADLVATFGPPSPPQDEWKSDAEWQIDVPGVGPADLYNYKDGRNYLGETGLPTEQITEWHVGGTTAAVIEPICLRIHELAEVCFAVA